VKGEFDYYGFGALFGLLTVLAVIAPLGIWKLVEIVIWVIRNVNISIG